jgi:hypothetical protein
LVEEIFWTPPLPTFFERAKTSKQEEEEERQADADTFYRLHSFLVWRKTYIAA